MDTTWELQPHTEAKHQLYTHYLAGWWAKLLQTPQFTKITYVDAFAGPGNYSDGEPGSPIIAIRDLLAHRQATNLTRDRARVILIEREPPRYRQLLANLSKVFGPLDQLPAHVETHNTEADPGALDALSALGSWGSPMLINYDSWGSVNVPLATMKIIAASRSSEVLITFNPQWFSRHALNQLEFTDKVFGSRERWLGFTHLPDDKTDPQARRDFWLTAYSDALRSAGFKYTTRFSIVPNHGNPLALVFGTNHTAGIEVMKNAMWKVDPKDGSSFRDPRKSTYNPDQSTLFDYTPATGHTPDAELLGYVQDFVDQVGACTVNDIREWLLVETSRWLPRHARDAVLHLRDAGTLVTEPHKVTKTTTVHSTT